MKSGFEWKTDVDPITSGIWLSEAFVLKRSNGEEIAVLLMDTQGVFDDMSTQRDWSTIVGISLLMSSCIIFNVMFNISEDVFMTLNTFLDYGLQAAQTNTNSDDKPFQTLVSNDLQK